MNLLTQLGSQEGEQRRQSMFRSLYQDVDAAVFGEHPVGKTPHRGIIGGVQPAVIGIQAFHSQRAHSLDATTGVSGGEDNAQPVHRELPGNLEPYSPVAPCHHGDRVRGPPSVDKEGKNDERTGRSRRS